MRMILAVMVVLVIGVGPHWMAAMGEMRRAYNLEGADNA